LVKAKRELRIPERRSFERYICGVQLAPNVTMVDVSEGGAQLECAWKVPLGAVVYLPMDNLFSSTISLRIPFQVVHVRLLPETGRHRIHGRFLDTPSSPLNAFRTAIRRMDFQQS
jgi:hypothetical protein